MAPALQQDYCSAPAGALSVLARVADRLQAVLQQPQQLNKQHLTKLLDLGTSVTTVFNMTSAIWPQNVLLAKVFEPILQPWIGLSAALLSIMGSQQARSVPEKVACETLNALPGTVHCISAMIATSPKDKNTGLIPADATARPLYLSGDLYKLLVFLLAMIAHGRYSRYKGVSPWLAPDSSGATGMRPSTSSSSQQQRGGLQIAPYHVRLLRNSGLDHWKTPQRILDNFSTE